MLDSGHAVVRVHTRLTAGARRSARERGTSDPIDADAVGRVAPREPDLPKTCLDGRSRNIKLPADQRPAAQRTADHTGSHARCTDKQASPCFGTASSSDSSTATPCRGRR